ncbi:acyl carrier protein [Nocardia sp. NPDC020380]|uniref:acyl carrier protein n=1 Tax=Nocardia sp. NPDC020380 TaxID=3364309 RepID=UPI0037A0BB48
MRQFTIADLWRIIRECAGEPDAMPPGTDLDGATFRDLGYDSVVMLEAATKLDQEFGVALSDEVVFDLATPRAFLDAVRERQVAEA